MPQEPMGDTDRCYVELPVSIDPTEHHIFAKEVDKAVKDQYDLDDGGDLCWNLMESGVINMHDGVDSAARIVAQHIEQA